MEKRITFLSDNLRLEGIWRPVSAARAVVVTHPHPLYGGDMHNPVVTTIADSFAQQGYATLRFNFRGTGASEGGFDDGPGERRDLEAALNWVRERISAQACIAGYSFGGWVAAGAASDAVALSAAGAAAETAGEGLLKKAPLYLVSPPVGFISFDNLAAPPALSAVVAGTRDEFAPLTRVRALLERWQATQTLEVLEGCDHFYSGFLSQLARVLAGRIPAIKADDG